MTVRLLATLGCLLGLWACDTPPEPPPPPDAGMRMPPPEWAVGTWVVTGHTIPGVSAMTNEEAGHWDGRALAVTDTLASGPEAECVRPSYRESLEANASVSLDHKVAIGELPLRGASSTVLQILCEGVPWTAFGGQLIVLHPDTVLTSWDGVFFVLGRR